MDAIGGFHKPERYVIGFTENQYSSVDEVTSPSPTDHQRGYCSPALDYAERTNKGAENIFHSRSMSLEKERHKSVWKINHDILDLVFEMSERRKTPLNRSFRDEFRRCDSDLTDYSSSVRIDSASSGPLVEVQQLPPITKPQMLPEKETNNNKTAKKPDKHKKKSAKSAKKKSEQTESGPLPKLWGVVQSAIDQNKAAKAGKDTADPKTKDTRNVNTKENDSYPREGTATTRPVADRTGTEKWKAITDKLVEANKMVKNGSLDLAGYKGRYLTPGFSGGDTRRRMSYCQCSYDERAEKARMNNIRRRHISQARTGPLDFHKLRRQITNHRSKTILY